MDPSRSSDDAGQATTAPPDAAPVGLTGREAARRLAEAGPNAVADSSPHPVRRALGKLWAPVPWMLEAAIVLELVFGEYAEAIVVGVLLLFNAGLGFVQEQRAQNTLAALKSRLAATASVRRDGAWAIVPAAELVPGDVVTLSLGAIVPADVRIAGGAVLVDQSMLTGESVAAEKRAGDTAFSGGLVRRGEAVAEVTATGERTQFGRSAGLIRTAHVESSEQKAIFRVVRNLAVFNGVLAVVITICGFVLGLDLAEVAPLFLVALLASIPVALPSMFTLAETVGARHLADQGVLPTRLTALEEAAGVDVLCADKTGTLTMNALTVGRTVPTAGFGEHDVLALAALASSPGGSDPVDTAVREAAGSLEGYEWRLAAFQPFDPALKMATATVTDPGGAQETVSKGAYQVIAALTGDSSSADRASGLEHDGFRVLAVSAGPAGSQRLAGLIGLTDPPRPESRELIGRLAELGVRTVMVTGDAAGTADTVARQVGIRGKTHAGTPLPPELDVDRVGIFAGVLPEDKYDLVKTFERRGRIVAMCGDGVNDAPALRQAHMGIAVFSATEVARSAAGVVLTEPGLGGIIAAVREGRSTFQRILTYTLRSVVHKVVQVMFLLGALLMTGNAIITPVLMVLMMVAGDFLAMSSSTDNVRPSPRPNVWRIGNLTIAGVCLGVCDLAFCLGMLAFAKLGLGLGLAELRTFAVVTLVLTGQAVFYVSRERRHLWSSRPGKWVVASSVADIGFIVVLAAFGLLMAPLPLAVIGGVAVAALVLAFVLDGVKVLLFRVLAVT